MITDIKLSKKDKKILKFASQSGQKGHDRLTIEQIALDTGCTEDYIYSKLSDVTFRGLFFETLKTSLAVEVPAILQMFVKEAKGGSFKHGKLILEIAGVYNEETNINLKAKVDLEGSPFASEEDKAKFVRATFGGLLEDSPKC